jgi:hypothetical protein
MYCGRCSTLNAALTALDHFQPGSKVARAPDRYDLQFQGSGRNAGGVDLVTVKSDRRAERLARALEAETRLCSLGRIRKPSDRLKPRPTSSYAPESNLLTYAHTSFAGEPAGDWLAVLRDDAATVEELANFLKGATPCSLRFERTEKPSRPHDDRLPLLHYSDRIAAASEFGRRRGARRCDGDDVPEVRTCLTAAVFEQDRVGTSEMKRLRHVEGVVTAHVRVKRMALEKDSALEVHPIVEPFYRERPEACRDVNDVGERP